MSWLTLAPRIYLALPAAILFVVALGLSWTEGGDHLWVQAVAMGLALVAFWMAAMAARPRTLGGS